MTAPATDIVVLINPTSGRGRGEHIGREVEARLTERGAAFTSERPASPAETASHAVAAAASGTRTIVVVGGDGTIATVVNALAGADVALAIIPGGTGDDLARALGIPRGDAAAAADLVLDGARVRIDTAVIEGAFGRRRFLTVLAAGFDSKVSETTNRLRWPHGVLRYYRALLIEVMRLAPVRFRIGYGDEPDRDFEGTLIAVANTSTYGGGMPVAPDASPTDGLLDVTTAAAMGRLRLLQLFPRLLKGTHRSFPEIEAVTTTSMRIDADGLVIYADGERVGPTPVEVRIEPATLTVCVPASGGTA